MEAVTKPGSRTRGQNGRTRHAVLKAVEQLLATRRGCGAITVEKVAARAKVAKTTIYRWWPSKAALFIDLLDDLARRERPPAPTGSMEADLRELVGAWVKLLMTPSAGAAVAGLIAETQIDPGSAPLFREAFLERWNHATRALLARGKAEGCLPEDLDIDLVQGILCGSIWYRLLAARDSLNRAFADQIVGFVLHGIYGRLSQTGVHLEQPSVALSMTVTKRQ